MIPCARLTWDEEPGAVALPRLGGIAMPRHAAVIEQLILLLHVQDVQGSGGRYEKSRS